jgi:hypothetical protein
VFGRGLGEEGEGEGLETVSSKLRNFTRFLCRSIVALAVVAKGLHTLIIHSRVLECKSLADAKENPNLGCSNGPVARADLSTDKQIRPSVLTSDRDATKFAYNTSINDLYTIGHV